MYLRKDLSDALVVTTQWLSHFLSHQLALRSISSYFIRTEKNLRELISVRAGNHDDDNSPDSVVISTKLIVIEGKIVTESLHTLCEMVLSKTNAKLIILLENRPANREMRAKLSLPEGYAADHASRLKICRFEFSEGEPQKFDVVLSELFRANTNKSRIDGRRVSPNRHFGIGDTPENLNELSTELLSHLASLSASIHLNRSSLLSTYVQMQAATGQHPSVDALTEFQRYCASIAETPTVVNTGPTSPSEFPPANNALVTFADIVRVSTRYTYLLLGPTGCGKTTFTRYFFSEYLRRARPSLKYHAFHIDFLRYDFVNDAHTLCFSLYESIFASIKQHLSHPSYTLLAGYSTFHDFIRSAHFSRDTLLGSDPPETLDVTSLAPFIENLLTSTSQSELEKLWLLCNDESELPSHGAILDWRDRVVITLPPRDVIRVVRHFAIQSQSSIEDIICDQLIDQFVHTDSNDQLRANVPVTLEEKKQFVRSQLRDLLDDGEVYLILDNADRTAFPAVELAIFRTAWQMLAQYTEKRASIIFSMRQDTFSRHGSEALLTTSADVNESFYLSDVANVARQTICAPKFLDVAITRVNRLINSMTEDEFSGEEPFIHSNERVSELLRRYVLTVLQSEVAEPIFSKLFEGDLRRNLELFERAVSSPHMIHTGVYFYAKTNPETPVRSEHLRRHRLLTSLMLESWATFKQDRSYTFLNVFNAECVHDSERPWRSTLSFPIMLHVLENHGGRVDVRDLRNRMAEFGLSRKETLSLESQLIRFRLARRMRDDEIVSDSEDELLQLQLTTCGYFYLDELMYTLEYLQCVYWDMRIPEPMMHNRSLGQTRIVDLYPFYHRMTELFAADEQAVRAEYGAAWDFFLEDDLEMRPCSTRIANTAGGQVARIYDSR